MEELTTKQEKFYKNWEEKRKRKWLYVFLHGTVYWGLFMATTMFLWNSDFKIENMHLSNLFIAVVIFGIAGIPTGLSRFKQKEKMYLSLFVDNKDILNGINTLKNGKTWMYENLSINNIDNETLVVRNNLFWFDKSDNLNDNLNECYDTVVADYLRINKDAEFEKFSKNYKVRIQIFEVPENQTPLIDKMI